MSLRRGFVKEALSLVTWVVASIVAWMFAGNLSQYLVDYIDTPSARVIAACAILFIAALLVGALINYLLGELIRVTGLSGTDRILGMAFGAARGGLVAVLLVGFLSFAPIQSDAWWADSKLIPHFLVVADWLKELVLSHSSHWLMEYNSTSIINH
ncbi:UNVERIFIED_CONTAM: hypothetical protein GTU68_036269 [Idotea baltica]|nr:hypothetical protein [Idotea baltica]